MNQPYVQLGCVANLFSRQMHFKKTGDLEHGHTHPFDHLTLLASGSLRVTVNGKTTDFVAPQMIYIKAEHEHELVALVDDTVAYCIHALRKGNGVDDIIDPASVPNGVSPIEYADTVVCAKSIDMDLSLDMNLLPVVNTTVEQAAQIRSVRNAFLAATDFVNNANTSREIKDLYEPYRQALRDVPAQSGFPTDIIWPVKPA